MTKKIHWYTDTYQLEQELIPVVSKMELAGVRINIKELQKVKTKLLDIQVLLEQNIQKVLGKGININSNEQLSQALFDQLKLQPQIAAKSKKGFYSVDKSHLNKLKGQHKVIMMLLDYRKTNSLLKSVDQLSLIHPKTKRLHAGFNQVGTATGRFSSSKPNMQNVPNPKIRKDETDRLKLLEAKFRELIIPAKGCVFVGADYSQIELRVTAEFSQDPFLLKAYRNQLDIHRLTASEIFSVPFNDVTDEQRQVAKSINFGLIYGKTAIGLASSLTEITGKQHSQEEAEKVMQEYFNRFSKVKDCLDQLVIQAEERGYSTTLFGRRRPIPQLQSNKLSERNSGKRLAMNSPIQGSAADIIKMAMIAIDKTFTQHNLKAKLILQVHDEVLVECPKSEAEIVAKLVKQTMENVVQLSIPIEVDLAVDNSWAEVH
ncbi:MAG: DNA polymerase [Flavobacteriales bacterium]